MFAVSKDGAVLSLWRILLMPTGRMSRGYYAFFILGVLLFGITVALVGSQFFTNELNTGEPSSALSYFGLSLFLAIFWPTLMLGTKTGQVSSA